MAQEHTKGPWSIDSDDDIVGPDGDLIAHVYEGGGDTSTWEANNRLVSAAPELLAAIDHPLLREVFGSIEDSGTPEDARRWGLLVSWFDTRDAALAKVAGT